MCVYISSEEYKVLTNDLMKLCETMLQELHFARVHQLIYDQFDAALHELKIRAEG
jgi:hypothetical protein